MGIPANGGDLGVLYMANRWEIWGHVHPCQWGGGSRGHEHARQWGGNLGALYAYQQGRDLRVLYMPANGAGIWGCVHAHHLGGDLGVLYMPDNGVGI